MGVSTLSGLVAAFLAALAPSLSAKPNVHLLVHVTPVAHIQVLRAPVSPADKRTRTCNARGSSKQASRVEKQLAPVACEQPPRSKVILTIEGGLFGSGR